MYSEQGVEEVAFNGSSGDISKVNLIQNNCNVITSLRPADSHDKKIVIILTILVKKYNVKFSLYARVCHI